MQTLNFRLIWNLHWVQNAEDGPLWISHLVPGFKMAYFLCQSLLTCCGLGIAVWLCLKSLSLWSVDFFPVVWGVALRVTDLHSSLYSARGVSKEGSYTETVSESDKIAWTLWIKCYIWPWNTSWTKSLKLGGSEVANIFFTFLWSL